jgi:hypothetical protein
MRLFDVRHDFPDAWAALRPRSRDRDRDGEAECRRELRPAFTAAHFPFVQGRRVRDLNQLFVFFAAPEADPGRHHLVRFRPAEIERDDRDDRDAVQDVVCVATRAWPGLFCGVVDLGATPVHPVRADRPEVLFTLEFPESVGEICSAYLLAGYSAACRPRCGEEPEPKCGCARG